MKKNTCFTFLLLLICQLFLNNTIKATETDTIGNLRDTLLVLSETAENELLQSHFGSMLEVINSRTVMSITDSAYLIGLYWFLTEYEDTSSVKDFSSYLSRERDLLVSWESPTDGEVSFAWLRLPENWDPDASYPLYIYLHGADWYTSQKILNLTVPQFNGPNTSSAYENGYYLLPWGRGNTIYTGRNETDIWECLQTVEERFHINPARRYITGHSLGGFGSWYISQRSTDYWAAVGVQAASFSLYPYGANYEYVWRLNNTPVMFVVGDEDEVLTNLEIAYNRLREIGNTRAEWLLFHGGHVVNETEVQAIYQWFQQYERPAAVIDTFMGEVPKTDTASIFGEGVVSLSGRSEFAPYISARGDSIFISHDDDVTNQLTTSVLRKTSDVWTGPEEIYLAPDGSQAFEVSMNKDNTALYFTNRSEITDTENIFMNMKKDSLTGWDIPVEVDTLLNTVSEKRRIQVSEFGNIFFSAGGDLYYSLIKEDSSYSVPEKFEYPVNTDDWEGDLYVHPYESYLLFVSTREDGQNRDIYISYKFSGRRWTNPKKIIEAVNTPDTELSPYISPNEKQLFFSRIENGETDLYWIANNFTEALKNTNFIVYHKSNFADRNVRVGTRFYFTLPDTALIDDDGFSTLTLNVTQVGGEAIPDWLSFSMSNISLSGTPDQPGTLELEVRAVDRDGSEAVSTLTMHILEELAVEERDQESQLFIYPNPADDIIRIEYEYPANDHLIYSIYSLDGMLVQQGKTFSRTINCQNIESGMYLLKIQVGNFITTERIIIR
jgi:predicted esterase